MLIYTQDGAILNFDRYDIITFELSWNNDIAHIGLFAVRESEKVLLGQYFEDFTDKEMEIFMEAKNKVEWFHESEEPKVRNAMYAVEIRASDKAKKLIAKMVFALSQEGYCEMPK